MSDLKLFRLASPVTELPSSSITVEKALQALIEQHLPTFLGVRLLASEYSTGKTHGGRIDTLGIDEDGSPAIVEYKRATNENVINQGLFYLDWLLDHRGEFELLVTKQLGQTIADTIDWSAPRLLCIAGDFTRYDEHAVQQIDRDISLIRYKRFGEDLLALELVNAAAPPRINGRTPAAVNHDAGATAASDMDVHLEALKQFLLSLGDDVQLKPVKHYLAFKRLKNYACVQIHRDKLTVLAHVDPDTVTLVPGFTRDVREIGRYGTGDLEIVIRSPADLERAKPLLTESYDRS